MTRLVLAVSAAVVFVACTNKHDNGATVSTTHISLSQNLKAIEGKRIYFGHQSVGANILQGLEDLRAEGKMPTFEIVKLGQPLIAGSTILIESGIGKNEHPRLKCDDFVRNVSALAKESLDVALMKFCYVDINANTNIQEMFRYYVSTVESLRTTLPGIRIVHVTVPLASSISIWNIRRIAKRILGREGSSELDNLRRNEFNRMLLEHFKGEPVFDLAKIESTRPSGEMETFEYEGKRGNCLFGDYTDDGGHLNALGRTRAAEELLRVLAESTRM
jgi:hypothetical protein